MTSRPADRNRPNHRTRPTPYLGRSAAVLLTGVLIMVTMARPAAAAMLWDGAAERGFAAFGAVLCDGGQATITDWNDGRGKIFSLNKIAGVDRCELHSIDAEQHLGDGRTLWFGWSLNTKTANAQTVFQWKSDGTGDQQQQNYPVIMKVEDSRLKVWYVAPGEIWTAIGSAAWTPGAWHAIELKITTSSGTAGAVEVFLDGTRIADRSGIRTWDDLGNKPRWGTYGATIEDTASHVWVDDPRLGTSRGDV